LKGSDLNLNTLERKLWEMKEEAIKDNDVIVYNAINTYQRNDNDPTVLIKFIKQLYDENKKLMNQKQS
jgi:hypothetical protein